MRTSTPPPRCRTHIQSGRHLLLATIALPYVLGEITGKVFEEAASTTRSGLGDARMKVSVNLLGTPALTPAEFAKAPRRTNIGTSLTVAAPMGHTTAANSSISGRTAGHSSRRWVSLIRSAAGPLTSRAVCGCSQRTIGFIRATQYARRIRCSWSRDTPATTSPGARGPQSTPRRTAAPTFAWMAARRRPGRTTPAWAPRWRCQSPPANHSSSRTAPARRRGPVRISRPWRSRGSTCWFDRTSPKGP